VLTSAELKRRGIVAIAISSGLYELAWNTLRDLLRSQGEAWMLMLQDRNLTSYIYETRHSGCHCGSDHRLLPALFSAAAQQAGATG